MPTGDYVEHLGRGDARMIPRIRGLIDIADHIDYRAVAPWTGTLPPSSYLQKAPLSRCLLGIPGERTFPTASDDYGDENRIRAVNGAWVIRSAG